MIKIGINVFKKFLLLLSATLFLCGAFSISKSFGSDSRIETSNDGEIEYFAPASDDFSYALNADGLGINVSGYKHGELFTLNAGGLQNGGMFFSFNINILDLTSGPFFKIYFSGTDDVSDCFMVTLDNFVPKTGDFDASLILLSNGVETDSLKLPDISLTDDVYDNSGKKNIQFAIRYLEIYNESAKKETVPGFKCNSSLRIFNSSAMLTKMNELLDSSRILFTAANGADTDSAFDIDIMQAGEGAFYDYHTAYGSVRTESQLEFSKIVISWNVFGDLYDKDNNGYIISRAGIAGGAITEIKKESIYLNKQRDSGLKQGLTYVYAITGYDFFDGAVPLVRVRYEDFYAGTKSSSPMVIIGIIIGMIALIVVVILLYVYLPDIKKLFTKRGKAHGSKKK